jgi:hypothetical protein
MDVLSQKVLPHFCCNSQNMLDYLGVNVEKNVETHGFPMVSPG